VSEIETIRAWLPPKGMTSIPEKPIKPAEAQALHEALDTLEARLEALKQLEEISRRVLDEIETDLPRRCLLCANSEGEHVEGCATPDLRAALARQPSQDPA
jgi:hypothetical protein